VTGTYIMMEYVVFQVLCSSLNILNNKCTVRCFRKEKHTKLEQLHDDTIATVSRFIEDQHFAISTISFRNNKSLQFAFHRLLL
jgi:hypothetical protein